LSDQDMEGFDLAVLLGRLDLLDVAWTRVRRADYGGLTVHNPHSNCRHGM
jgi:hypothetical protein